MNESFRLFPEAASQTAKEVDYLSLAWLAITVFFSAGIAVAIIFFVAKYWHSRNVNRVSVHSKRVHLIVELTWSIGPLLILMVMFTWGAAIYIRAHQPPKVAIDVYVVAKQWMWKVGHENGRREINALHLPVGTPVRLTMISEDVIHSFFVPAFRVKHDVLPGRYSTLWFDATQPGTYHLFCAEYCGTDHSKMIGEVVVQSPEEYASWLSNNELETMAQRGRRLVEASGCLKCHGYATGEQIGPYLTGLYGRSVALSDGDSVLADDGYIRRSILDPQAQKRAGFAGSMPSYDRQLDPEQILEITAYLRSIADATGPFAGPSPDADSSRETEHKNVE